MRDLIERQAAIDALHMHLMYRMGTDSNKKRLDDWINGLPSAQETHEERTETHACDLISRQAAIDAIEEIDCSDGVGLSALKCDAVNDAVATIKALPLAQPELIEKAAYIRGFEQGRTQGMIDSQGGKKMNKQRKVLITITYNEMGIIVDTKAEEVAQPDLQPTCNNLATDAISRKAAIDEAEEWIEKYNSGRGGQRERDAIKHVIGGIKQLPPAEPEEAIPTAWLEEQARWFENMDNAFAKIEANNIRVMIKRWRGEKDERLDKQAGGD